MEETNPAKTGGGTPLGDATVIAAAGSALAYLAAFSYEQAYADYSGFPLT